MSHLNCVASYILLALFLAHGAQGQTAAATYQCNPSNPDVSNACLGCICEASSKCNQTIGCISGGELCGPFLISQAFWVDAGRCTLPGQNNAADPQAFASCASDLSCASDTLRSYFNRFSKDCNGDQLVTCDDYLQLHKNGGWNCGTSLQGSKFSNIFEECKSAVVAKGFSL